MSDSSYIGQLGKKWGLQAPKQFYRMLKLHRTSFNTILNNMFGVLDEFDARFAFPTVAAIAKMNPELVKRIEEEGHEVASHGYNHVRYPTISVQARQQDLLLSLQVFKKMGVKISGFRAPYDNYTDDMPELLEQAGLLWDGGFGFRPEYSRRTHFFRIEIHGRKSSVTYIPLNAWSDDVMIDRKRMKPDSVSRVLRREISKVAPTGGVIMFDLHPIRIGQKKYIGCLQALVEHAQSLEAWCTTPTEAVKYWNAHKKWKSESKFCLLLTGDIDNWVFSDYLRRVLWRRGVG